MCRRHGITKWPYCQLLRVDGQLGRLEEDMHRALSELDPLSKEHLENVTELQERIASMRADRAAMVAGRPLEDSSDQQEQQQQQQQQQQHLHLPIDKKPSRPCAAAAVAAAAAAVAAESSASESESESSEVVSQPLAQPFGRPFGLAAPVSGSHFASVRGDAQVPQKTHCCVAAAAAAAAAATVEPTRQQQQYQQFQQQYQQQYHQQYHQQYQQQHQQRFQHHNLAMQSMSGGDSSSDHALTRAVACPHFSYR
jgi:hypothetical protein